MSALHRLKAYFGMVPAEEFDAARFDGTGFDAPQFSAAERDGYHLGYRSGHPASGYESSAYAHQSHDPGLHRAATNLPGEHHYASEGPAPRRFARVAAEDYGDGFSAQAGHHAASRVHASRSSSAPMDARGRSTRAPGHWAADAPVRGSLAIDTAAAESARIDTGRMDFVHEPRTDLPVDDDAHPLSRIVTLHPHSYNEARPIGERYREGNPVIMNLTSMEDRDAKRLVDFAAGLAFALRGSIDKITNKVFLLSPPNVEVSAEDRRRIAEGRLFT